MTAPARSPTRACSAASSYVTTPNELFSVKVFWGHAEDLIAKTTDIPHLAGLPGHQCFRRVFGGDLRAVLLRHRTRDVIGQSDARRAAATQGNGHYPPP